MSLMERLDRWGRGARGPLLAALLALLAGLPGVLGPPPIDRDESRFAEASAQMLETGDFVTIHFQDQPRFKKPVGVYWLQAASVALVSHVEDRAIWAYRLPSLAGALLAAAACAWGAGAFLSPGAALASGALMGGGFLLSTEAGIAATDGALCGAVTLMMAALGRIYLSSRGGPPAGAWPRFLFWTGLAASILLKGPIGPMILATTLIALMVTERRARWIADLGWGWGLIGLAVAILPWALAITVATDGAFWGAAVGGDLAPKLIGDQEGHGAPFGLHALLTPLLVFPATLLLPTAAVTAWRRRDEPAVRFALCWLIPAWLVFEITTTKLIHYTLPLHAALFWLMARSLKEPTGPISRVVGAALLIAIGGAFALAGPLAALRLQAPGALVWALPGAAFFLLAVALGASRLSRGQAASAMAGALVAGVAGHAVLAGLVLPALKPLWLSSVTARALAAAGASPRQGVIPGPVTVAGYAEPSLVFLLGADTELAGAEDAAEAVAEGRPAIVEGRQDAVFQAHLRQTGAPARLAGTVKGLDYSKGSPDILRIYLPAASPAAPREGS